MKEEGVRERKSTWLQAATSRRAKKNVAYFQAARKTQMCVAQEFCVAHFQAADKTQMCVAKRKLLPPLRQTNRQTDSERGRR